MRASAKLGSSYGERTRGAAGGRWEGQRRVNRSGASGGAPLDQWGAVAPPGRGNRGWGRAGAERSEKEREGGVEPASNNPNKHSLGIIFLVDY